MHHFMENDSKQIVLTSKQMLQRLQMALAQIKASNPSY